MQAQQQLLQSIEQKLAKDNLILPTLPEVALKVRQQADDPNVSLHTLTDTISYDAALASRVIKVANSAFMGRSIKVSTLHQAVTRIGLSQIRNIVIAMALEQLFVSVHPTLQQQLTLQWQRNVQVTSIAVACLSYYNTLNNNTAMSLDVLTLAGLVHNIGALAVINEIDKSQETLGEPRFLLHISAKLAPIVSEKVLTRWQFSDEFIYVAKHWRTIKPEAGKVDYTDFIRLAMIAKDQYEDKALQQKLLNYYVAEQLVPNDKFMQQPEINTMYQNIRAVFS